MPEGVAPKFGSEKVSRYTGVSQLQLRVSRYTVQLSREFPSLVVCNFYAEALFSALLLRHFATCVCAYSLKSLENARILLRFPRSWAL